MSRALRSIVCMLVGASCVFIDADPVDLGGACIFNGDCASPLICAGRHCRAPCRDDRDCVNGWRCLGSGVAARRVCLPPDERGYCLLDGDCEPLVCGAAGACVEQCRVADDCRRYSATGALRCHSVALPQGGSAGVCENHPWLRDGGAIADASIDAPRDVSSDAIVDARVTPDAPRVDAGDGGAVRCPTEREGACTPSDTCAVEGVSMGGDVACAWFTDGSVRCWGDDASNLLITGAPAAMCERPTVRFVGGTARELSINSGTGCFRTAEGTARCWGAGLLGDGGNGMRASAEPMTVEVYPDEGPVTGVTAVAVTIGRGACVVAGSARRPFCWGPSGVSLSADGSTAARTRAVENLTIDNVDAITLGGSHACALRGGAVWCFGQSSASTGVEDAGYATAARQITLPMPALSVTAGAHHTCAVLADHTVRCFGTVWNGGTAPEMRAAPLAVAGLTNVEEVAGFWNGTNCARRTDGSVWCWGEAEMLGDGSAATDPPRPTPAAVPGLTGVRRLFGRDHTACAWRGGAELWCWGRNPGVTGVFTSTVPVRVRWSDAP